MVDVDGVCRKLDEAGVTGVSGFRKKLQDNRGCDAVVDGLLLEARAAMRFRQSGCGVEMGDRPDLKVASGGCVFFAEVTHFRRKLQDDVDDAALLAATDLLVPYGDTAATEGKQAWDQLVDVARKKVDQYRAGSPNILVAYSHSPNCVDEAIVPTSIASIESICRADLSDGLRKLNGILLVSEEINVSRGFRSAYYFECSECDVGMPGDVARMLRAIVS